MTGLRRSREEGCLSDLRLDALALDGSEADPHLATCGACTARLELFRKERESFAEATFEPRANAIVVPLRSRSRWLSGASVAIGTAALAAAILLGIRRQDEDETRTKGGRPRLEFYVEEDGHVRRGSTDEPVHPADRLQFVYVTGRPGHLVILSVDGDRRGSIYFDGPIEATHGREVAIPHAIALDDVLGRERLLGLFCETAPDAETLRREYLEAPSFVGPKTCQPVPLSIVKTPKVTP